MFYVYVLSNPKGILYKGFTSDLEARLQKHNAHDGFSGYTQGKGPWELIYKEEYENEAAARAREKFLKSGKGRELLKKILGAYPPQADG